ncbi:MAG TPA: preprotein translocase subunit SecG [Bacteroidales bacterium]|nr:preprotein translocase subunit SecG [Bacteroidales bacterium]
MYSFVIALIIIISILLVLVVLVQRSKGGGLAQDFNSGNSILGVKGTTDFIEKTTWTLAAALVVLSIIAVGIHKNSVSNSDGDSRISQQVQEAQEETQAAMPANFGEEAPEEASEE